MPRTNILREITDKGCDLRFPAKIDREGKIKSQQSENEIIIKIDVKDDSIEVQDELESRESLDDFCEECEKDPCECNQILQQEFEPEAVIITKKVEKLSNNKKPRKKPGRKPKNK